MRIKITGPLTTKKRVPLDSVLKTHHQRLKRLWRDSVKAFVLGAMDAMTVVTGMSVASLQPLAAQVRLQTIVLETLRGKGPKNRKGFTDLGGGYHANQSKSRAHGRRLGQRAYKLSFGTPRNPDLRFEFEIVVFQHEWHERTWKSLEKGKEAFVAHFETNFASVVRVDDLVSKLIFGS